MRLAIPNFEVRTLWEDTFQQWLEERVGALEPLHAAILAGDAARIEGLLSRMLLRHVSTHDVSRSQEEAFYHAFTLGLLVSLEPTHHVRSNCEVGLGRADVLLVPKAPGAPGVVLEFKRGRPDADLGPLAEAALEQIRARRYADELTAARAAPIRLVGIAFSGKDVAVRASG